MKSTIMMFGIDIPIEVPNKPKKRRRKGAKAKAPSAPPKDKMTRSPGDGGSAVAK